MPGGELRSFVAFASDRPTLVGGVKVAAVVGTVLNAINQGDRLLALRLGEVTWWKVGLTYLVPFCVSVFSASRIRMLFVSGGVAHRDARLRCRTCGSGEVVVRQDDRVPSCPSCGPRSNWRAVR